MMVLAASIILTVSQFIHGLGLVFTKKLINTNTIHINYFVGLMLLFTNAFLVPAAGRNENYNWPTIP